MPKNAQFAIEFIVLLAFMFLVFLGFISVVTLKVTEANENERQQIAEEIAQSVSNEVYLAKSVEDGYSRSFELPALINGNRYSVGIIANRELVVNYTDKEHLVFLPEKVCGDILIPDNEIDKDEEIICVNSNFNYTQCQKIKDANLCDGMSPDVEDVLPGTECCCCDRYGICCPTP
ncbi:hypothetical protein KY347_03665 [Candidatus Woesearchaeota archaeon]|nr:hypothetical protein [Candidatus Woesearchaeota archaeon]